MEALDAHRHQHQILVIDGLPFFDDDVAGDIVRIGVGGIVVAAEQEGVRCASEVVVKSLGVAASSRLDSPPLTEQRIALEDGDEVSAESLTIIGAALGDTAVAAAKVNLDTNLATMEAAWNAATE